VLRALDPPAFDPPAFDPPELRPPLLEEALPPALFACVRPEDAVLTLFFAAIAVSESDLL